MKIISLLFILGCLFLTAACSSSKTVVLNEDFDLGENSCFEGPAPIDGIVKAGTKVKVTMLKGSVAYISIPTAVNRKELEKHSTLIR